MSTEIVGWSVEGARVTSTVRAREARRSVRRRRCDAHLLAPTRIVIYTVGDQGTSKRTTPGRTTEMAEKEGLADVVASSVAGSSSSPRSERKARATP